MTIYVLFVRHLSVWFGFMAHSFTVLVHSHRSYQCCFQMQADVFSEKAELMNSLCITCPTPNSRGLAGEHNGEFIN